MGRHYYDRLTEAQVEACQLEFDGTLTATQIGERVGVHRSTIQAWRRLPAYREEYDRLVQEQRNRSRAQLRRLEGASNAVLATALNLKDEGVSMADRLKAVAIVHRATMPQEAVAEVKVEQKIDQAAIAAGLRAALARLESAEQPDLDADDTEDTDDDTE